MAHKLLLADDSVTIQRVIELTFADEDVQVLAVGDGKQAIERLESERPDIVLADVGMPERDGYEVASFIKGHPRFSHIPVLLLTGAFEPVDEARARSAGCDGVLVKPFEPQMVINRVKDLLAGRKPGPWGGGPPPPPTPFRQPAEAGAARAPQTTPDRQPSAPAGSLEDYFDRLDAAFGSLEPAAADAASGPSRIAEFPTPARAPVDFGQALEAWDPHIAGDPGRPAPAGDADRASVPAPIETAVAPPALTPPPVPSPPALHAVPPPQPVVPSAPPAAVPEPMPSLAEAFAALLAAERSLPAAAAAPRPAAIGDDAIEEIVQKVLARMTDQIVRETVLAAAERLVREEIERIKKS
jgi:CheY-like chemotaxis protein